MLASIQNIHDCFCVRGVSSSLTCSVPKEKYCTTSNDYYCSHSYALIKLQNAWMGLDNQKGNTQYFACNIIWSIKMRTWETSSSVLAVLLRCDTWGEAERRLHKDEQGRNAASAVQAVCHGINDEPCWSRPVIRGFRSVSDCCTSKSMILSHGGSSNEASGG